MYCIQRGEAELYTINYSSYLSAVTLLYIDKIHKMYCIMTIRTDRITERSNYITDRITERSNYRTDRITAPTRGVLSTTRGVLARTRGVLSTTRGVLVTTRGVLATTRGVLATTRTDIRTYCSYYLD